MSKIIYTVTDEAPMLATYSLLPVFQRFAGPMGVSLEKRDISVAGRSVSVKQILGITSHVNGFLGSLQLFPIASLPSRDNLTTWPGWGSSPRPPRG